MNPKKNRKANDDPFRALFQQNPQAMWVFDKETLRFLEVNQCALDLLGYSREEFLELRVTAVRVESEAQPQTPHSVHRNESAHRTKDGRILNFEVSSADVLFEDRPAVLAVLSDPTQRRLLEEQVLQAQKMAAVGMLAGGVAHDFNNLLTIITGYSQLILGSIPIEDRNRSAAEQIMKAGERAAALTRQLLAFSRRQAMQPKVLDVNLVVGGLAIMLRRLIGEDIDLRLDLAKDLGQVNADPSQIEQVIMNLTVNARDAMPKGGVLTLATANVYLDENYTSTHTRAKPGPYVVLSVSDTGTGMDAATRSRLFEPFFTTKEHGQGTGLGLSIVFGIVRQAGGTLEVLSEHGAGTSVRIYLPRVEQAVAPEVDSPAVVAEPGSETILLVEDEDTVRKLVRETLEREGYKVLEAAGPDQARRIARNFPGPIQLMITDVVMPKENGRTLARRLASLRPEMKVLYMSGYADTAITEGGIESAGFLQKPFTPAALTNVVRNILKRDNGGRIRQAGG